MALPADGKVVACDVTDQWLEPGRTAWKEVRSLRYNVREKHTFSRCQSEMVAASVEGPCIRRRWLSVDYTHLLRVGGAVYGPKLQQ